MLSGAERKVAERLAGNVEAMRVSNCAGSSCHLRHEVNELATFDLQISKLHISNRLAVQSPR